MPTPFGERLRAAWEHGEFTQTSLEASLVKMGLMSRGYMSRILYGERGERSIDFGTIEAIADLCGVDFHWLATGRGSMLPPRTPEAAGSGERPSIRLLTTHEETPKE